MAQDLRDLFKDQSNDSQTKMSEGHEARFLQKLDEALPQEKKSSNRWYLNIAASIVVVLGISYGVVKATGGGDLTVDPPTVVDGGGDTKTDITTLGDLSPDLKKVEDYYLASINLELSKIQLTPENKELFDGYISRLEELNKEYDRLTLELTDNGANELTIDALINNLKLRLNLLYRLKEKLKEFNTDSLQQST